MDAVLHIVSQVVAQRLRQKDVEQLLGAFSHENQEKVTTTIADILSKIATMMELPQRLSNTHSLDVLLQQIVAMTTKALNVDHGRLFLHDKDYDELYIQGTQGMTNTELRFASDQGIVGSVFTSGQAVIVPDASADPRFNQNVDAPIAYPARNILYVPIKARNHDIIGVIQLLNKKESDFTVDDLMILESMTSLAAETLQNTQLLEQIRRMREEQTQFLEIAAALSQELHLQPLILKIMETASAILEAERSTLFLYDDSTDELWSLVAQGVDVGEIRFPSHMGIAGATFTSCETLNISDAYADPRFNPEVDKKSGFRTRSILCMPMTDKVGTPIGVTQVLNKHDGPFTSADEKRLQAFSTQAAMAIENAKLFDDVFNMRNYNESILQSLSNGVITLSADNRIVKCNEAALRILGPLDHTVINGDAEEIFSKNAWITKMIRHVCETGNVDITMDTDLFTQSEEQISVNATVAPLINIKKELIGSMLVFEDITSEKRIKSTFGRYLSKEVVNELLSSPTGLQLGGELREVTFLVSDLRGFTSISSRLPPQDIINILNRYLERMVDIITYYRGTVDEFQGDGILAFFGAPLSASDDPERAIACAIAMQKALVELNDEQRQRQMPELVMGIGINTGEAIVGNIGSEKRAKYGAVGSAINTAYRIESYTVGGQVLVSPSTYERVRSLVRLRGTLEVEFKGLDKPMTLYDVAALDGSYHLDLPETASATFTALAAPLSIDCFPVQGKTVAETAIAGQITHLAASAAEVTLAAPLALLTNLKIVLTSPEARGLSEVYAKVLSLDTSDAESVITKARLEFTSLPGDAKTFLAQHLVD